MRHLGVTSISTVLVYFSREIPVTLSKNFIKENNIHNIYIYLLDKYNTKKKDTKERTKEKLIWAEGETIHPNTGN